MTRNTARQRVQAAAFQEPANGALESLVPTLALELQPLRVDAVAPGAIATAWWSNLPNQARAELFAQIASATPVKRNGRPEDVAQVITTFISNTLVTGTIVDCAGDAHLR